MYDRTTTQKRAGTTAAIDVLRAQVRLEQEQQQLIAQENQVAKDKLALGRVIGLPSGQQLVIADTEPYSPLAAMTPEEALHAALEQRADLQSAKAAVRAAGNTVSAARAERYPNLNITSDYGGVGTALNNSNGTFTLQAAVKFNIFDGGRKRFFIVCIFIFTVASVLCGSANGLSMLLLSRVIQGAGGGLQPMAQAILADTFPPAKRGLAFALYGITAIMAPTIGPTLGGWITDNYSWRWIFFINLPVGLLAVFLVMRLVEDPPFLKRTKRAGVTVDYIGISLLALGVGALQVVLDKGQEDDWFGSRFITRLVVISVVCLIGLVIWEWRHKASIVDVHLFKNFNFATASVMMFIFGVLLFGALVTMPQFL